VTLEAVATVVLCVVLIAGFTLAGMSLMKRGVNSRGATGTLGSVLGMIDLTGVPTRQEAAAAREELKQRRHEAPESGRGPDGNGVYDGKIIIAAPNTTAGAPAEAAPAAEVKGKDII
jgi:hypothetical protein